MLYSMTGFASDSVVIDGANYALELRSVNSKNCEISLRLSSNLRGFEPRMRQLLSDALGRGKIDCSIELQPSSSLVESRVLHFDSKLFAELKQQIAATFQDYGLRAGDYVPTILEKCLYVLPAAEIPQCRSVISDEGWQVLQKALHKLLEDLQQFRLTEGEKIAQSIELSLNTITKSVAEIRRLAPNRLAEIRATLQKKIRTLNLDIHSTRLEQELFFYADRLDIAEELQRVDAHLQHFARIFTSTSERIKGKKLNFIILEVGRELNTICSKAQCSLVQTEVILAKEQLEQIKEQLSNVL